MQYVHETIIRDIVDVVSDIKNSDHLSGFLNREKSFSSIAKASSNLTLVFPVLASKTLSIENAGMIAKAIERKAVTMLQMLFSAINITDSKDGFDYLKNFHTNLKIDNDISVDSFIDIMDKYVVEHEAAIPSVNREKYEAIKRDLRNINYTFPDSLNETSLNDYKVMTLPYQTEATVILEKQRETETSQTRTQRRDIFGNLVSDTTHTTHQYEDEPLSDDEREKLQTDIEKNRSGIARDASSIAKDRIDSQNKMLGSLKTQQDILRNQLMDSDVKKANELIPSMMAIHYINTQTGDPIADTMVIGVKAKIYPLDSVDIMNRITLKNQDHNGFLKFIKASTREISFFKDFLFAIDQAKIDALSQSKRGSSSKLWKILERRSKKSKIRRIIGQKNDASAITTLVVSQEEVEYMKKASQINIEDPKIARPIMESYNLMGFCIVDETMETAKFLWDTGDDIYEALSFNLLERETSDNGYKKVINLMTKLSR